MPDTSFIRAACVAAALVAIQADAVCAQIYSWRDPNGTLVLSDRPLDPSARTFAVLDTAGIRSTREAADAAPRHRFGDLIQRHAAAHGVRPELVSAVIQVESGFNPRAVSPKGALGLMQLMPGTAADLGVRDCFDPDQNIRGGVTYLRSLLDRYDGDEELALAAYNAGPEAVQRHGRRMPPFRETRDYVTKVRAASPAHDGVTSALVGGGGGKAIYKTIQIIDGRPVPTYSNRKPAAGEYTVVR